MGLKETLKGLTSRIKKETDKIIDEKINLIMDDEGASEKIDSFKEVADYITSDQSGALDMMTKINANTSNIEKLNTNVQSNTEAIASKADVSYVDNLSSTITNNLTPAINAKANASDVYTKDETHTKDEIHQMLLNKVSVTDFNDFKNTTSSWIQIQFDSDNINYTITTSSGESYNEMNAYINTYLLVLGGDWEFDFRVLRYVGYGDESGVVGWNFENSLYFLTLPYNTAKAIRYIKKPTNSALQASIADLTNTKASINYVDDASSKSLADAKAYTDAQDLVYIESAKQYTDGVNNALSNSVNNTLTEYAKTTDVDAKDGTTLNQAKAYTDEKIVELEGGNITLEGYVTTDDLNTALENKANTSDVYTTGETDELLASKVNNINGTVSGAFSVSGAGNYVLKINNRTITHPISNTSVVMTAFDQYFNTNAFNNLFAMYGENLFLCNNGFYFNQYDGIGPTKESLNVNLGGPSYRFNNLYLKGVLHDGTNSISVADIAGRYSNAQIDDKINLLLDDEGATSTLDSFKEIRDYLAANQDSVDLVASVQRNTEAINSLGDLAFKDNVSKSDVGLGNVLNVASYSKTETDNLLENKLSISGGNISGHIYLTGSKPSSSTGNTSQIVFGTSSTQHVALSSNDNALVINPTTTTTTNQIVLYLDKQSQFPSGITSSGTINAKTLQENGTALSSKYQTKEDATDDFDYTNGRIDTISTNIATNTSNISKLQTTVAGKLDKTSVVNNLLSSSTTDVLSAYQGKILLSHINNVNSRIDSIVENEWVYEDDLTILDDDTYSFNYGSATYLLILVPSGPCTIQIPGISDIDLVAGGESYLKVEYCNGECGRVILTLYKGTNAVTPVCYITELGFFTPEIHLTSDSGTTEMQIAVFSR